MKRRVLALLLTAAMLLGMTPVSAVEAEGTVITGFAALEQDVMEAETGTAREDLGLPETVTATVLETVTTLTGNGEGEDPTVTTQEVETEREISVEWSTPLFGGYDPDQAGEYTFTAGAQGYVLAEGVEWPTITVTLTEPAPEAEAETEAEIAPEPAPEAAPEAEPETAPEVQAVPVITGFTVDGETSYEVAAGEEMTAEIIAAGLAEDVIVTANVDGEDEVLPVDWSCPDFDGQTNGTYTFTAYAQGYALAEGAAWPTVTVEVTGAEPLLTATVTTWTDLSYYSMTAYDTTNTLTISGTLSANSTITIASGRNITISGGTINRASGFTGGDLFSVSSGGTLTLKNVTINGNNVTTTQSAVEVASGGKFTAQGCTFQNNKITTGGYNGAAINNAGTATISGCTLQNNTVSTVGPAVYSTGTLTINANGSTYTTISGNTCTASQGAVAVLGGTAEISYTKIQNNTAGYGGPALYVSSGTVTIGANTTISGNKATSTNRPGAIWVSGGTLTLNSGSSISSNTGLYGVDTYGEGTFNMNGGTISGNGKGGVYFRGGTFKMTGGSIINNTGYGITVASGYSPSLSGAVTVTGNSSGNVYLPNASTKVTLAGAVTGSVGVTQSGAAKGGTFATASSTSIANNSAGKFFHDPGTYSVTASATSLVWGDPVASVTKADGTVTKYTTLQAAVNAAGTGDTVTLLADTSETVTITTSFDTLDWTGHTLTTDGKLDISGAVNTIQNTVDGQQNYATGGVSFTATNQYVNITGTVGEIKGGCYSGTTGGGVLYVASADATLGKISGGWFKNTYTGTSGGYAINYTSSAGGTVITGGVFDGVSKAINGSSASTPIVLEGGYFSHNTTNSEAQFTGTLGASKVSLPEGYGGISTDATYYTLAPAECYVSSNGSDTAGDGTREDPFATLNKALEEVTEGGTVHVMDNVTQTAAVTISKNVTITGAYTDADGNVRSEGRLLRGAGSVGDIGLAVSGGVTVAMKSLTYDGSGTAEDCQKADAAISVLDGSTLNLDDVVIQNHHCWGIQSNNQDKGVIHVAANGILHMTGGALRNNTETQSNWGIISVLSNGQATLTDVTVEGNTQTVSGPILKADDTSASLTLAGSTAITNNTAPNGAVWADTLNLSGTPVIRDNHTSDGVVRNVYRDTADRTINVTGTLAAGSAVGVTDDNAAVGTAFAVASSEEIASASASAFSDDTGAYAVAASGTAFQWKVDNRAVYVSSSGNDDTGNGTQDAPYATLTKALAMVADGGTVYVMDPVTVSTDATISKNVTITGAYTDANGDIQTSGQLLRGLKEADSTGLIEVGSGTVVTMMALTYEGNGANTSYQDSDAAITVRDGATLNLTDVVIQNHHCKGGATGNLDKGVIHVAEGGALHMTGGALRNNTETMTSWGIISGVANSQVTLTDVTVTGNKQTASGPILMVAYEGASLTLAGSTTITGNRAPYGAVYATALNLSGQPVIQNNTTNGTTVRNVYLDTADKTITVTGALAEGSAVGVSQTGAALGSIFATATDNGIATASAGAFFQDAGPYIGAANGESLVWAAQRAYYVSSQGSDSNPGTREKPFATLPQALSMVADGGTVYVMDNVTGAGLNADFAKSVTITTDPLSVTEDFTAATATLSAGSSLMTLNGADSTVTLKNITLKAAGSWGTTCMITVTSGALVLDSGATVTGYSGTYSPVYINGADGSVTLNEGSAITGNTSSNASGADVNRKGHGGGVYMADGALTLNGGSITNNTATYRGGGVSVDGGTLTMTGGEISGNTAYVNGGGVYLANSASSVLNLSGGASITGNTLTDGTTVSNVYKQASSTINVTDTLTGPVGVTDASAAAGGAFATANSADIATASASAFSDDTGGYLVSTSGASLVWQADTKAVYVASTGSDTTGTGTRAKPFQTLKQAMTKVDDGGTVYVMDDVTTAGYGTNYTKNVTITTDPKALTKDEAGNVTGGIATVNLRETLAIPNSNNTITLENITFDGTGYTNSNAIFYIGTSNGQSYGHLHLKSGATIQNFTGPWGPVFTGSNANNTVTVESGARIINNTNTGSSTSNYGTYFSSGSGGGITMNGGTLTINGGEISGNKATCTKTNSYGGGVYVSGTVIINGGVISGNTAICNNSSYGGYGGGVYVAGTLIMNGGTISNNTLSSSSSNRRYGGGVYVTSTFTMTGGTISGNTAVNGGGVYVPKTFTMTGGTISGNTATTNGGGVYANSGSVTMSGGAITGNTAATQGGGVWLSDSGSSVLNLSGTATVTGNTLSSGTANNVYRQVNSVINVTDTLTGTVGVTYGSLGTIFATATTEEIAAASADAFSDDTGVYLVGTSGARLVWTGQMEYYVASSAGSFTGSDSNPGTREKPFATLAKAMEVVGSGGTVYVMDDITEARSNIQNGKDVTITTDPEILNTEGGQAAVVTMTGTTSVIIQTSETTLTLKDIVFDGNGQGSNAPFILGVAANNDDSGKLVLESGAVIRNFSSQFGAVWTNTNANNAITIKAGASITGNKNTATSTNDLNAGYGGGITLRGGALTMSGGEISGNTAGISGGGVFLANGATMTMSGGTISGNTGSYGGGVYANGGTFNMAGGEIRSNTATNYGGGVDLANNGATMTMEGGTISGNTGSCGGGVYLSSSSKAVLTMSGGEIRDNTATNTSNTYGGGGLYIAIGTTVTMTSGTITGNTAAHGGGVYLYRGALTMEGGAITGNTAATQGGGVSMYNNNESVLNLSGGASITGNTCGTTVSNVYKEGSSGAIKVTGSLTEGATVGVTYGSAGTTFATATTEEIATASAAHFLHDVGAYKAVAENTSLKWALRTAIQLDAPTVKGLDYTSVTIDVTAGQTYILRETATGEALQTFAAPGDGTHTFQDLTAGTAYYIYTTLPGQAVDAEPYYTDSANTVVRTRAPAGAELIQDGSFEDQNASGVWQGLNVDSAATTLEIGVGNTSYGLTAADGNYVCELNGYSNSWPEAVYQKVSVYPGATITVTASVAQRGTYTDHTMQIGVMPATASPTWADFTDAALTPTVTSGKATVNGTVIKPASKAWSTVQCTYTVPEGVYEVYVIFQAVTPVSGASNIIDKISVKEAAEYYVSSTGSDETGNGTQEKPYATLDKAVGTLPDEGGTIHVMNRVNVDSQLEIGETVTITGTDGAGNPYAGAALVNTASYTTAGDTGLGGVFVVNSGGVLTLDHLTLDNTEGVDNRAVRVYTGGALTLSETTIQNFGVAEGGSDYTAYAVYSNGAVTLKDGSRITGNLMGGIQIAAGTLCAEGSATVTGNTKDGVKSNVSLASGLTVTVTGTLTGALGVTQAGAAADGTFATTTDATIATDSAGAFSDDTGAYKVAADGVNIKWVEREKTPLDAPTVSGVDTTSVTIDVKAGQTYILRETADGEASQTYAATENGTYTFEGLTAGTTYYIYTTKPGQAVDAEPYYGDSANTVAKTRPLAGTELIEQGSFEGEWNKTDYYLGVKDESGAYYNPWKNTSSPIVEAGNSTSIGYGQAAKDGSNICELNYQQNGVIYQKVSVAPGAVLNISVWYAARGSAGTQIMQVCAMPASTEATDANFADNALMPTVASGSATVSGTQVTAASGWSQVTSTYTVPAGVTSIYVGFRSVTPTGDAGNLIDLVSVKEVAQYYVSSTGNDTDGIGTRENPYQTLAKAVSTLPEEGGTIHVMDTVTQTATVSIGKNVTITSKYTDADGNIRTEGKLLRGSALNNSHLLTVTGGNVTLADITLDGNNVTPATLSGDTGNTNALLSITGGTVTLDSGAILQNNNGGRDYSASTAGAAVVAGGALVMNEGAEIKNCSVGRYGGAVTLGKSTSATGTFTMNGGSITGNSVNNDLTTAAGYGGTVYIWYGTFTMNGGSITGNTVTNGYGAGVYQDANATVNLSGSATITGNTADGVDSNVYLESSKTITVTGDLTGPVGVTQSGAANGGTFATASSADIANASVGAFVDDTGAFVAVADSTSLKWAGVVASVTKADGTVTEYGSLQAAVNAAGEGDTVTLLADTSETVTITTSFDTLEWGGKTLTGKLTINSGAVVNTIQNTVDGAQNYTTGGISGGNSTVLQIQGTVGEIKGGYYRLNASYEAVAVSSTGKIERISGGWFYGNKMGICWMGGGNGGTVITGGVLQGDTTAMGAYNGTLTNPIVLEGGYYSSNTFTFTSSSTLDYTGTLSAATTTLPEGYGGISTTTTYYTLAQTDFYVSSDGSDTTGDGTRENPYNTVYRAFQALNGISGTIYVMDQVYLDSATVNSGTQGTFILAANQSLTIQGDPERAEGTEARILCTAISGENEHTLRLTNSGSALTLEDVILDGQNLNRNGAIWLEGANSKLTLGQGAVITNMITAGYGTIVGNVATASIYLTGGQITGNTITFASSAAVNLLKSSKLYISGDSAVTGNVKNGAACNIAVAGTSQLVLNGDFTGAAGVYQSGAAADGQFGTIATGVSIGAGNFTCDSNPALSSKASGSNLVWAANRDEVYVSINGNDSTGDGTEQNPYKTLLYAYGKVNAGGTIHVMTANVPTAVASGYVNALGKYIAVNKSVTISGVGYEGASVRHNNGNAPILMASNSNYTTTFKDVDVTSAGSALLRYGNADNALIDIRNGVVTLDTVTVSGHYNNGTANGRSSVDWSDGTLRVAGGTLNLTDTTVTNNTTNGAVYKIGGTVNLSGATSITGNTRQGTGGANLYLKTASQSVNVADDFAGAVGVTQAGAVQGVTLAVATGETQAQAKTGMFTDDANTGYEVRTSGANLIWGKDIVTYVPDKYRIVVISDNADETFTITKNGVTIEGAKVYDEELGQYVTTFEGLDPNTTYPVASSKGTTQNVKTLNITALEKAIRSASPFTVYEGETVSLATVLGSKVAHLSGCVSLTDMSISDESYATVSGSGRTAKITGVKVTGNQQIDLTLTASTRGCGVYGTCNTGEITIQIIVVPQVVIRTTVADRTSIVVGDCSTKLQYALYDASGNLVSNWVSPTDDGEGGLYVRFDGLTESTNYTVKARYGDGDNDYGTATKTVKTTATSALQKAIESASPFTIYEGETVTLASVLGSKVYHLSGCVSLTNMVVTDTGIATVSDPGRSAKITGVELGSTDITMTASTNGCYYYGTTTANGVKITVNVIPKVEIKSVSTTTESITVSNCDTRFQYALYDADGKPVGDTEWLTPNEDGTITWDGLTDKTNYTVTVRYGDGDNSYGTASKTVTTGQIYNGTVAELYSYSQGTGVTAGFKVNMAENPGTGYTLQVTDANGDPAGTATLQGSWYGGNYVVKVTNLTAGTTYTVQAVVNSTPVGEALEWTAPAETYNSHNSIGNTSGYWSSSDVSTKTDSSGATQVVSGIAYNVKSNGMSVDIQGYGKTKTTYANAGWTVKVSGGSNLWVWAEPTIVKGESGADYVVLTYHIRNNSASSLSNVWLGANADIMIGSNDRAPVYMEDYGIRTAVNEADDALSFAIITQHGGGVAEYADSVTTRWFGYYGYRNNYTFSNTNSTSLTGTDSGAAFSWKVGALAAGETREYSVVIGVAGKEDQNQDITNPAPFTETETGPEETVTETQLAAPTVTATTTDSVTINVVAGQTYILRLDADGESYMEFEATEDGTYTFEGLAPSSTYYIYTKLTEQDANANPFYTESANATAATKATAPGQPKGDFILNAPTDWNENDLTYQFGNAEATLTNVENFKNLSVMVDTGSFTLTQEALTALGSYGSVAGVSASGSYVKTVTAGSKYTYLIFSGTFTKTQAENFLRALIFNAEGYGVYQQVDVDADVIDLPSGVARLGSSYYRYVAYRGITWSNAYKAAKASSFNGLPGYLITVDSSVEHNFVYQTYGSVNGWMGGLRTTADGGFDGATYNPANPGTSGAWKWVCGPNAGDPFWNGYNSSSSNRIPGVYANWNSGEPNNASGEWAAQYGFGSGGRWNDYKPTNSAIGGYFIEYTAYGSYSAADPMAHDDQTNVFGAPVAVIWVNGVKGTKTYSTLAKALEDYTDSTNQVIQMIANTEEDSVTIGQDVYLDLNGHEVKADITVSEGFTLYGLDTTTDGYKDLEKYGQITGTVTGTVGSITKTTKSHFAKAKNYLPVSNGDNSLEFHRFNTVVYKYTGKIDNEADTAMLNYTLGFQGDSTVVGQLEAIGAGARISGSDTYTYGWNYELSAVPRPSNPYLYDTNLVNLSTTEMVNGYTTYYDLVGALKFGGVQVDSESVKRSFLQVLKLYYNKTNAQEKEEIMTFITNHDLNAEWEALG